MEGILRSLTSHRLKSAYGKFWNDEIVRVVTTLFKVTFPSSSWIHFAWFCYPMLTSDQILSKRVSSWKNDDRTSEHAEFINTSLGLVETYDDAVTHIVRLLPHMSCILEQMVAMEGLMSYGFESRIDGNVWNNFVSLVQKTIDSPAGCCRLDELIRVGLFISARDENVLANMQYDKCVAMAIQKIDRNYKEQCNLVNDLTKLCRMPTLFVPDAVIVLLFN